MSNCFYASVVIVDNISFQAQYFKQSQADVIKTLLNTDPNKKLFALPAKISEDAHDRYYWWVAYRCPEKGLLCAYPSGISDISH